MKITVKLIDIAFTVQFDRRRQLYLLNIYWSIGMSVNDCQIGIAENIADALLFRENWNSIRIACCSILHRCEFVDYLNILCIVFATRAFNIELQFFSLNSIAISGVMEKNYNVVVIVDFWLAWNINSRINVVYHDAS